MSAARRNNPGQHRPCFPSVPRKDLTTFRVDGNLNGMYLVISCSLSQESRSRLLAMRAVRSLQEAGQEVVFWDLRASDWPLCDGETSFADERVAQARDVVSQADGILLATPIYNFDVNAAAKNFVELTGRAWENKVVGFLCAAGGHRSYMSVMGLANSLMLDFRCFILPRYVYTTGADFTENDLASPEVCDRLDELTQTLVNVATRLSG